MLLRANLRTELHKAPFTHTTDLHRFKIRARNRLEDALYCCRGKRKIEERTKASESNACQLCTWAAFKLQNNGLKQKKAIAFYCLIEKKQGDSDEPNQVLKEVHWDSKFTAQKIDERRNEKSHLDRRRTILPSSYRSQRERERERQIHDSCEQVLKKKRFQPTSQQYLTTCARGREVATQKTDSVWRNRQWFS